MGIYTKKTRTQNIDDVITLEEVKRALNILDDEDDNEIENLMYSAFEMAEAYCHRCFSTCNVRVERDDGELKFFIPFGENVTINSVILDDEVLTTDDYEFSDISEIFSLTNVTSYEKLVIEYSCGFNTLPYSTSRGIKYLVSTMFNSGQDFVAGMDVNNLPIGAKTILDTEKHHVV